MSIRPVIIRYADSDERPRASRAHDGVRRDSSRRSASGPSGGAITVTSAAVAQSAPSRRTTSTTLDLDRARSMSVQPQQSGSVDKGKSNAKGNPPINISAHSFSDWSLEQVESDLHKQAHKHVIRRMRQTWLDIEHRHTTLTRPRSTDHPHAHSTRSSVAAFYNTHIGSSRAIPEEDDDIIDLETMQIVQDRGMLRRIKNGAFALEPRLCGVYQTDLKVKNKTDDQIRAPDPADDDREWQSDDESPPAEDPEQEEEDELARMDDLTSQPSYEYFAEKRRRMNERQSLLEFHRAELYARRSQSEAMSSRAFDDDPEEEWSRMEKSLQASFGGNQVLEDIDPGHGMPEDPEGDQEEEDEFDAFYEDALPKRIQDRLRRKRREWTIHQLSPSSPRARSMAPFRRGRYHKAPTTSLATKNQLSIKRTGPTFDRSSTAPPSLTTTTSPGSSSSLRRLSIGLGQVKLTSSSPLATRPVISGTHPPSESSSDPPSSSMSPQRQKGRPRSILRPVDLSSERESSPPPLRPREPSPEFERPPTPDFPRAPTPEFQRPPTPPLSSSSSHAAFRPPRIRQHSFSLVIEQKFPSPKPYVLGEPPLVRQPRRKVALSSPTTQAQSSAPAPPRLPLSPSPTPGPSPSRRRRAESSTTSITIAEMTKHDSQTLSASPAKKHKLEPFVNQILDPLPEYDALDEEESEDELGWDRDRDRSSVGDCAKKRRTSIGPSSRRASSGLFKTEIKRVRRRALSTFEYSSFEAKRLGGAEKEDEQRLGMTGLPTPPTSRGAEEAEASRSLMLGNGSSSSSSSSSSSGAERPFGVVPLTSPHRERPQNQHNRHRCSYPPLNHPPRRTSFPNPSTHFSPTLSTTRQLTSETSWVPITYLTPEGFRREGTVVLPSEDWDDGPTPGTGEEDGDGSEDELMLRPWASRDDGLLKKKTSVPPLQSQEDQTEAEAEQDEPLQAGPLDPPPRGRSKSTFSSPLRPSSRSRLSRGKTIILELPPLPALPEESEDELDCI
ncbi:hypothetical protein MVLG_04258 [Microbotryum lychnidis-dioicae p1A1 Lamole]|uniref:Uncharacterized protein n=1 Tax=Microbotryum lychnidis-dioicae (strain p1A1 Lamole / MvSl-1064) TaxID=683840 RepID=U5HAN6_USTV1|nr:hypothetical protein MVLG_04258 [Microbotryum lychnidis-dioicae p1A1 Lamole]|eukprot:KDE05343.1 hypothetical protein MVLG_04258 [Microbotryum lychnidis-dioicae p1A1 Lamole]